MSDTSLPEDTAVKKHNTEGTEATKGIGHKVYDL